MSETLTGSCLCGAIRFTVSQPVTELRACHCVHCQKTSGGAGSVNAVMPANAFKITRGTPKRFAAKADSGRTLYRHFCADCGSPIYSQRENPPETVVVRAGAFDNPPPMKIGANIWTRSKRPWAYIDPESKQLEGQP